MRLYFSNCTFLLTLSLSFKYLHRQKSKGVRSEDLGGQSMLNVVWYAVLSCWNQLSFMFKSLILLEKNPLGIFRYCTPLTVTTLPASSLKNYFASDFSNTWCTSNWMFTTPFATILSVRTAVQVFFFAKVNMNFRFL